MKKWLGGLLALVVAVGFGMGWNYMWSKSSRDKGSSDPTSVVAEAEENSPLTNRTVTLKLIDEDTSDNLYNIIVNLKKGKVTAAELKNSTYAQLLKKVKDNDHKDYRLLMQYYDVESSLRGGKTNQILKSMWEDIGVDNVYKLVTLSSYTFLNKKPNKMGYTLNKKDFKKNLAKEYDYSKLSGVVEVPYKKNDTSVNVNLKQAKFGTDEEKTTDLGSYTIHGVNATSKSLDFLKRLGNDDDILSPKTISFSDQDDSQLVAAWLFPRDLMNKQSIIYGAVDEYDSFKVLKKVKVKGHMGTTTWVTHPDISDYSLDEGQRKRMKIKFTADPGKKETPIKIIYVNNPDESSGSDSSSSSGGTGGSGDGSVTESGDNSGSGDNNDVNTGGNGSNNTNNSNANNTTTSVSPFKVYGKQKLYRYSHATFTNNRRVQAHAKKVKAHAPVFTVVGKTTSKTGAARYVLNDGTHITANANYVGKLYWANHYRKLYVTNPQGINTYKSTTLNQKVKSLKQGTAVTAKAVAKKGQMTRYRLADGTYITGNKQYVSPTKPKLVKQVKAKTRVRVYQDVNLNKVVKTYQPGQVIKVNGWNHSRGDVHHVSGVKRYKVAGGYITANSKYVKVVK